jgi:3-oxoacyl-[acyl-carrier protein] reductase
MWIAQAWLGQSHLGRSMSPQRVAIVTGASGAGIGRSVALTLARDGFAVAVNFRSSHDRAEAVVQAITASGGIAAAIQADVLNQSDCDALVEETVSSLGRVDACVICPGGDFHPEPPEQLNSEAALQDVVHEVSPIYYLVPRLVREMKKNSGGRIVSIASNMAIPSPSYAYNTAKRARIDAMLGLVSTLWNDRITINVIAPGPVNHLGGLDEAVALAEGGTGAMPTVTPQDVAEAISFLCSESARYVTGNVLELRF